MDILVKCILLFFAYSLIGWIIEVVGKWFEFHRFVNRGFNLGPYCPIYGSGALVITLSMKYLGHYDSSLTTIFVVSLVVCGLIEYFVGYFLELIYHARWWDYSQKPMNLHGRIWIGNSILFGLGGVIIIKVVNPLLYKLYLCFSPLGALIFASILVVVFIADTIFSQVVMKIVKDGIEKSEADNTEEVSKEIRELLADKSYFYSRFADAYPNVIYTTEKITRRINIIKAETEKLMEEVEERMDAVNEIIEEKKEQFVTAYEPSTMLKNSIIEKQEELINILTKDKELSEEELKLKTEIEDKLNALKKR